MRLHTEIVCEGEPVLVEINAQGELIFVDSDFDLDTELAAIELGFEPSDCFDFYKTFQEHPVLTFAGQWQWLPRWVWLEIFGNWCEKLLWTYTLTSERATNLGLGPLSPAPVELIVALASGDGLRDMEEWQRAIVAACTRLDEVRDEQEFEPVDDSASEAARSICNITKLLVKFVPAQGSSARQWRLAITNKILQAVYYAAYKETSAVNQLTARQSFQSHHLRATEAVDKRSRELLREAFQVARDWRG